MIMDKPNKLSLPATIIIASLILGGFFYASQVNKQRSIERQQELELQATEKQKEAELQEDRRQEYIKNDLENLKLKQAECQDLSAGVKKKWNNIIGVTYDNDLWKECVVTYTDPETGEVKTYPLRFMQDIK